MERPEQRKAVHSNPRDDRDDAAIIFASLRDPDLFAVIFDRHAPYVHQSAAVTLIAPGREQHRERRSRPCAAKRFGRGVAAARCDTKARPVPLHQDAAARRTRSRGLALAGLRAVPGVKDAAGRPGIQIEWNTDGYSGSFIVDAKTYAYLGFAQSTALLEFAVVDKVQQRP